MKFPSMPRLSADLGSSVHPDTNTNPHQRSPLAFESPLPAPAHLRGTAALLLAAALTACGPSSPDPAAYSANVPATTDATPVQEPGAVPAPPPAQPAPREPREAPRARADVATPKPTPIETPTQRVAQAPASRAAVETATREVVRDVKPAGQLGHVVAIETLRSEPSSNGTTGTVIGGVLGGVIGNQIGDGNGRKAATAIGAIGGAVAGNQIEKRRSQQVIGYRVDVKLDNGNSRSVTVDSLDGLATGDRVRYADGHLYRA